MVTRIKEGLIPYKGGDGIEITNNHVINLLLREQNNLIHINENNEVYTDLQLDDGILPTDDFPVGVTTGKILQSDGWTQSGLILNWKTTSGDYARLIYANDGNLYVDLGDGIWQLLAGGGEAGNVKAFFLSSSSDLTTGQAIYNWVSVGKCAIIMYNNQTYVLDSVSNDPSLSYFHFIDTKLVPTHLLNSGYSYISQGDITIQYSDGVVVNITIDSNIVSPCVIDTNAHYLTPYTPTEPGNPANKKYVDDNINTKTFKVPDDTFIVGHTKDLTTCQEAIDYLHEGKFPMMFYNNMHYTLGSIEGEGIPDRNIEYIFRSTRIFKRIFPTVGYSDAVQYYLRIIADTTGNTVTDVEAPQAHIVSEYISIDDNYSNAYMPSNETQPTSKKYVDQGDTVISVTPPSSPFEGQLWYDMVNDVLKSYDGTNWNIVGGPSANVYIYKGTVTDYSDLANIQNPQVGDVYNVTNAYGDYPAGTNFAWDGTTWDSLGGAISLADVNTKTFYLSSTSDLTNAQAAYDWYKAGKNPIVVLDDKAYIVSTKSSSLLYFTSGYGRKNVESPSSKTSFGIDTLGFALSSDTVTSVTKYLSDTVHYLDTSTNYTSPYTPIYNGSPTTKKYVDDRDIYIGASAPTSNLVEGRAWYDTANDVLKVYDGSTWNQVGGGVGLTTLSYGHSSWSDFTTAYNAGRIVYCKASSNTDPGSGTQGRMAFMAYVNFNSGGTPTSVEFQYYRSVSSHSASQQGDQVFVYKLESNGTWSVTVREAYTKIVAGTNMTSTYNNGTLTLNATGGGGGGGDVTGPSSATDGHLAVFDGTTGKAIKDGGVIPTGFAPASSGTIGDYLVKTANGYDWSSAPTNVKLFVLSSSSDITTAQAAYDWYIAGNLPILEYTSTEGYVPTNGKYYYYPIIDSSSSATRLDFECIPASNQYFIDTTNGYTVLHRPKIYFTISSSTVQSVSMASGAAARENFLSTGVTYSTLGNTFTPTDDGHPATKKYVDDHAGITNETTGTTSTVTKLRAGSETEYTNLSTKNGTTLYFTF